MKRYIYWWALLGVIVAAVSGLPEPAQAGPMLKMAFIDVESPTAVKKLARMGLDIAAVRDRHDPQDPSKRIGYRVEAVVSRKDEKKLQRHGYNWRPAEVKKALKAQPGTQAESKTVYHSFDEPVTGMNPRVIPILTSI